MTTSPVSVDVDALNRKVIEMEKKLALQAKELADLARTVQELKKNARTPGGYNG